MTDSACTGCPGGQPGRRSGEAMRRMTSGKPDAVTPPVRFDEGRGWDQKLTTTVCLTLLSQSRLLYFVPVPIHVLRMIWTVGRVRGTRRLEGSAPSA